MNSQGFLERQTINRLLGFLLTLALISLGACGKDPVDSGTDCEGVVCENPPPSRCETENLVWNYKSPGTCVKGECEYEAVESSCPHGCDPDIGACRSCEEICESGESECANGAIRNCEMGQSGCLGWSDFVSCENGVCADDRTCIICEDQPCGLSDGCCSSGCTPENDPDCEPPNDEELTTWVLLVTDLHFGDSSSVSGDFSYFLDVVVSTINPVSIINTGDMVDLGSSSLDWQEYFSSIEGVVPPVPYYFEIPGNHDVKEAGVSNYLSFTQSGTSGLELYGQTFINGPNNPNLGRIRVLRTNTVDSDVNAINVTGKFGEEQANELMALSPGDDPISYTLIASHHPLTGIQRLLTGLERMRDLVTHSGAEIYLCGHAHSARLSWYESTLVVQAASLGKTNPPGFSLISMDVTGPSAQMIDMTSNSTWPVLMITGPADPDLGDEDNPYAVSYPPGDQLSVRAIAFDTAGIESVEARLNQEETWTAMTLSPGGVWSTSLILPTTSGDHNLQVRATGGSGIESQSIRVVIAP